MQVTKECRIECPSCGGHSVEEILVNAKISNRVEYVTQDDDGNTEVEFNPTKELILDSTLDRYQCACCGRLIATTPDDLFEYLLHETEG